MRTISFVEFSSVMYNMFDRLGDGEIKADLSGNIFYQIGNELKPLNICIKELAQVAEFGGVE